MDISFSSDIFMYIGYGSDFFMYVFFSSDIFMYIWDSSWVYLSGIIVWVDECSWGMCISYCSWGMGISYWGGGNGCWGGSKSKSVSSVSISTIGTIWITISSIRKSWSSDCSGCPC